MDARLQVARRAASRRTRQMFPFRLPPILTGYPRPFLSPSRPQAKPAKSWLCSHNHPRADPPIVNAPKYSTTRAALVFRVKDADFIVKPPFAFLNQIAHSKNPQWMLGVSSKAMPPDQMPLRLAPPLSAAPGRRMPQLEIVRLGLYDFHAAAR